jgi:hypothetical protein
MERQGTGGNSERGAAVAQRESSSAPEQQTAFSEPGHRARLLENYNYDLVQELGELLQGVWRVDEYLKDSGGKCDDCGKIWQDVRKQKEYLIEKIRQELVNHAKDGRFV